MKDGNRQRSLLAMGSAVLRTAKQTSGSRFVRNVLILMSGTALAQAISLAFVPLLSRLYSPSAFGVFGVYASLVGIVASVAALRYDLALMLPKEEEDAANLLGFCGLLVAGIAILSAAVCLLLRTEIVALLRTPELLGWLWLVPISIFMAGLYLTMSSWSTRRKQFRRASVSQVVRASTAPGLQTVLGIQQAGPFGLMAGAIIGDLCATLVLLAQVLKGDGQLIRRSLALARMKALAKEYSDFPTYSTAQALLNTVSQYLPVMLLAHYFGAAVVGYYAIGVRIVQLPMNLVMVSLRQVLFQKASEVYNSGGDTFALFRKATLGLMAIAALPALLIMAFAPALAGLVLGARWTPAGEYARWLVFWLALMFCNLPAALFAQLYRRQGALLIQDVVLLTCRASAIIVGGNYLTPLGTIMAFSLVGVVFNLFLIFWIYDYLRHQRFRLPAEASAGTG